MKFLTRVYIPLTLVFLLLFFGLTWYQRVYFSNYVLGEVEEKEDQQVAQASTIQANLLSKNLYKHFIGDAQGRSKEDRMDIWKTANPGTIRPLMERYVEDQPYHQNGIYLRLYKNSLVNAEEYDLKLYYKDDPLQKHPIELSTLEDGEVHFVYNIFDGTLACVMRALPDCEDYKLVYFQTFNKGPQKKMNNALTLVTVIGHVASFLMVVFLALSIWKLAKPISELRAVTRNYVKDDRSQKMDPFGWDEVAELASLFNSMADENQRLELVEEDAERKQRFLDSFTHELRTPLTNIYGYSELMKRVQLTEEDRLRYLDYIMHESRRLNRLSEELFGLTVLRENTTRMERVSCGRLLDFAEQTLREKAQKKDVRLVCEQSDCTVYGSKALLESLCINLCENAIRACEAGDEVRVSFREEEDGAVLRVADTGRGIAPEDLAHITEPFYRVDKARSRAEGGVGLGLYLCSEIVRIHGAAMSFDSREGEGTTVTVRFPKQEQN